MRHVDEIEWRDRIEENQSRKKRERIFAEVAFFDERERDCQNRKNYEKQARIPVARESVGVHPDEECRNLHADERNKGKRPKTVEDAHGWKILVLPKDKIEDDVEA